VAGVTDEFVVGTDPDTVGMESKSEVVLILTEEAIGPQCIAATLVSPTVAGLVVLHRRCVHRIGVCFLKQSIADGIGISVLDDAGETLRLQSLLNMMSRPKKRRSLHSNGGRIIRLAVMRSGQSMSTLLLRRTQHAA